MPDRSKSTARLKRSRMSPGRPRGDRRAHGTAEQEDAVALELAAANVEAAIDALNAVAGVGAIRMSLKRSLAQLDAKANRLRGY